MWAVTRRVLHQSIARQCAVSKLSRAFLSTTSVNQSSTTEHASARAPLKTPKKKFRGFGNYFAKIDTSDPKYEVYSSTFKERRLTYSEAALEDIVRTHLLTSTSTRGTYNSNIPEHRKAVRLIREILQQRFIKHFDVCLWAANLLQYPELVQECLETKPHTHGKRTRRACSEIMIAKSVLGKSIAEDLEHPEVHLLLTSVVKGWIRMKGSAQALTLLEEHIPLELRSTYLYSLIVKELIVSGHHDTGVQLLERIKAGECGPNVEASPSLVKMLSFESRLHHLVRSDLMENTLAVRGVGPIGRQAEVHRLISLIRTQPKIDHYDVLLTAATLMKDHPLLDELIDAYPGGQEAMTGRAVSEALMHDVEVGRDVTGWLEHPNFDLARASPTTLESIVSFWTNQDAHKALDMIATIIPESKQLPRLYAAVVETLMHKDTVEDEKQCRKIIAQIEKGEFGDHIVGTPRIYNALLLNTRDPMTLDQARAYTEYMISKGVKPNVQTYRLIIKSLLVHGQWDYVLTYYDSLPRKDRVKEHIPHLVLNACAQGKQGTIALKVFNELSTRAQSSKVYNLTAKALGVSGMARELLELAQAMMQSKKATGVTLSTMITYLGRCGEFELASDIFHSARTSVPGASKDIGLYNAMMNALNAEGRHDLSLDLFRQLMEGQVDGEGEMELPGPDAVTFSVAITSCINTGDREKAIAVFDFMEQCNVQPDMVGLQQMLQLLQDSDEFRNSETVARLYALGAARGVYGDRVSVSNDNMLCVDCHGLPLATVQACLLSTISQMVANEHAGRTVEQVTDVSDPEYLNLLRSITVIHGSGRKLTAQAERFQTANYRSQLNEIGVVMNPEQYVNGYTPVLASQLPPWLQDTFQLPVQDQVDTQFRIASDDVRRYAQAQTKE